MMLPLGVADSRNLCLAPGRHSLKLLLSLLQRRDFLLRRSLLKPVLAFSFITATLGTNGWLDLVRQGLSPCKKRQASLGAPTVCVSGGGWERGFAAETGKIQSQKNACKPRRIPTVSCTPEDRERSFYTRETGARWRKYTPNWQASKPYKAMETRPKSAVPRCTVVSG